MLIEDNTGDIALVREALEEYNVSCELTVILNGERAITFIDEIEAGEQPRPDLIILDLKLPKKPGIEVLRRIRRSDMVTQISLVVLSSSDDQKDKEAVAALGPSLYVRKPTQLDEFLKVGATFRQILYPPN